MIKDLRQRRDMKRVDQSTFEANDVDEFGHPIVRLDENHNPVRAGTKIPTRVNLSDPAKKALPSAGVLGKFKMGGLDDLYGEIQKNLGKKMGDDATAKAAQATIEEKQLRIEAYRAIKDFSQRDTRPRAT
jgi:hypothetical protein